MIDPLACGKEIVFPVSCAKTIQSGQLAHLIKIGIKFVVIDVHPFIEEGQRKLDKDIIEITTAVDYHGTWRFERKTLEKLLLSKHA
jgi:hypothetical protein